MIKIVLGLVFLLTNFLHASERPLYKVLEVDGSAFVIDLSKNSRVLREGSFIYHDQIVIVDESSQIKIQDYFDQIIYLASGTQARFFSKKIDLSFGMVWLQSQRSDQVFHVSSPNAKTRYSQGDLIFTYDLEKKTQLLVMNGSAHFQNASNLDYKNYVEAGYFSFIADNYNDGFPRKATLIGEKSFDQLIAYFRGIKPDKNTIFPKNQPRVANEEFEIKKGKIIYIQSPPQKKNISRAIASVSSNVNEANLKNQSLEKNQKIIVRVFETSKTQVAPSVKRVYDRKPASVTPVNEVVKINTRTPSSLVDKSKISKEPIAANPHLEEFESQRMHQYKTQTRHTNEVNSLIRDLKSFDQDYDIEY